MSNFDENEKTKSQLSTDNAPEISAKDHAQKKKDAGKNTDGDEPKYSLNDDRRVKVLTPGMMVAQSRRTILFVTWQRMRRSLPRRFRRR